MRHRVVALALPGLVTFDLGCAAQVFNHPPHPIGGRARYDFCVCAPQGREVEMSEGWALVVDHGLAALEVADTVVVPGYLSFEEPPSPAAVTALSAAAARGARVMSICIGAFALAHAGLLRGRRATTHWAAAAALGQFPGVEVVPDVLYVDEGRVLTSAGLAAGLNLALHVVRRDHGAEAAAEIARWNVVAPHRVADHAQLAPRPVAASPTAGLGATRAWALKRLDQPLGLRELAQHACCSERTLTRRFRAETGMSPKRWLLGIRLQRARELLEATDLPVEQIAIQAGLASAAAQRALFAAELQTTPTAYGRAFRGPRTIAV